MVSLGQGALDPADSLMDAIEALENSANRIVVVIDENNRLLGTVTDGDIRRALLAGVDLTDVISVAMNQRPHVAGPESSRHQLLKMMRKANVTAIPVIDDVGGFKRLKHLSDLDLPTDFELNDHTFDFAVIMAGGKGRRLLPLTKSIPKPMVDVNGFSIIERQLRMLRLVGIKRVFISINYLGSMIEEHFQNGSHFGVELEYLREESELGTSGAISLIKEKPSKPILVMNGDVLSRVQYNKILNFHHEVKAALTVVATKYSVEIPYGVIKSEDQKVIGLMEKPTQQFLCNAGIYVLSPEMIDLFEAGRRADMTETISKCIDHGLEVSVFPLHEYWTDVGTPDDLEKARQFFSREASEKF